MADKIKGITIELGADTQKFSKGIKEAKESSSSFGEAITGAAKAAGAALAALGTAAAGVAVELGKAVVDSFADYEQLTGGVETLFKESSGLVQKYAEDAYKNSGLSANEYMETVTGFSASLISSLNGNTTEAAVYADQAIKDMSDNANKMGSDMESIQNAYAGFAKGQFTLLDNLKLGYGGTKTEMERLIADANALKEANGEMGDLTIDSYADIITAIHMVQTEMGITGTTAKEAEATISGSIAMTQSAYDNFIISLGSGEGMEEALNNLVESALLVVDNINPVVERLADAIPRVVEAAMPIVIEQLPLILDTAIGVFTAVLDAIIESLPMVMETVMSVLDTIVDVVTENLPTIIDTGFDLLLKFIEGIIKALPEIISAVTDIIIEFAENIDEHLPEIIELGVNLLVALTKGLLEAIPKLIEAIPEIIKSIVKTFKEYDWASIGTNIMEGLKDGLLNAWETVKKAVTNVCDKIGDTFKGFFGIESPSKWMRDQIGGNMMAGLEVGMDRYSKDAIREAGVISNALQSAFTGGVNGNLSALNISANRTANLNMTTPVYLDGRVIATVVNNQLGVLL